jgi:hypothetical protein
MAPVAMSCNITDTTLYASNMALVAVCCMLLLFICMLEQQMSALTAAMENCN